MGQCASPTRMGRKDRECIQVVRCYCHFFADSVCVVRAREKERRRLKGLCLLFYKLGLYVGFL